MEICEAEYGTVLARLGTCFPLSCEQGRPCHAKAVFSCGEKAILVPDNMLDLAFGWLHVCEVSGVWVEVDGL